MKLRQTLTKCLQILQIQISLLTGQNNNKNKKQPTGLAFTGVAASATGSDCIASGAWGMVHAGAAKCHVYDVYVSAVYTCSIGNWSSHLF